MDWMYWEEPIMGWSKPSKIIWVSIPSLCQQSVAQTTRQCISKICPVSCKYKYYKILLLRLKLWILLFIYLLFLTVGCPPLPYNPLFNPGRYTSLLGSQVTLTCVEGHRLASGKSPQIITCDKETREWAEIQLCLGTKNVLQLSFHSDIVHTV